MQTKRRAQAPPEKMSTAKRGRKPKRAAEQELTRQKKKSTRKGIAASALLELRTPEERTSESSEEASSTMSTKSDATIHAATDAITEAINSLISSQLKKESGAEEIKSLKRTFEKFQEDSKQIAKKVDEATTRLENATHAIDLHAEIIADLGKKIQKSEKNDDSETTASLKQQLEDLTKLTQGIRTALNNTVMSSLKSLEARMAVIEERQRQQPLPMI